ncbi:unnamed protein product [Cuscuta campestris]|uniref:Uncharacterized protein n=1 Tax=Cuscuta campestris TaxID=132261 RepID=A0A484KZ43_9ASTE|nr:unnamed protein product [Cuscuta campestris]
MKSGSLFLRPVVLPASGSSLCRLTRRNLKKPCRLIQLPPSYIKASNPLHFSLFALRIPELSPVKFLSLAIQPSESSKFPLPSLISFPVMSSLDSHRISSSEDCSSEDSNSSSSTGSSSPDSMPGQTPNPSVPDPQPVNQMPGEVGEIGPITADRLGMDSPTKVARLKKKNEKLALILKSQTNELAKLSKMVGSLGAENTRLKEENGQLLDEVSETKREMAEKEENFPGRAAAWVEENKAEAARVMTASPEATMESFRLLYREPEGKKMIIAIGSFGFKSGQKKDRAASHRILLKRDPAFTAASYGLAPIPEEQPTPPFPLD